MAEPQIPFRLQKFYLEIENWLIIDFNPVTGSITEYEDHELSADSFLIQLKTMEMLPSLRMPLSETSFELNENSKEQTSNNIGVAGNKVGEKAGEKGEYGSDEMTINHNRNTSARAKREKVWAEITRNLSAPLQAEEEPAHSNISESEIEVTAPERDESDPSDSPYEGSESPHTDPDFQSSSSNSTGAKRFLGTGMVGLKISDSLHSVASQTGQSMRGDIDENEGDEVDEEVEKVRRLKDGTEDDLRDASKISIARERKGPILDEKHVSWDTEGLDDNSEKMSEEASRRRDLRNVGLVVSATGVILAAIWMMEKSVTQ